MNQLTQQIFDLGKMLFQSLGTWDRVNERSVMTGLRKAKQFFVLNYKCPLCHAKTQYYTILCQARGVNGNPVGKVRVLPFVNNMTMTVPLENLKIGICPNDHKTARIRIERGAGDSFTENLIYQFKADKTVLI